MSEAVLEVTGLGKSFGSLTVSDDISLDLRPGEIHAVIGPNGAGKSTLIAQICGTLAPDAGAVRFLGHDVTPQPARARARMGLARTFQISALAMEDTVLQNALLGALGQAGTPWRFFRPVLSDRALRAAAEAALERVGLAEKAATVTAELSHGERRQLEVAVALTLKPRAFVMDEPMAGLGAEGSKRLTALLDGLREEAPILLVEHDMDAVFALADRISVLDYGRLIASGGVSDIRANPIVRAAYLGDES
jgi:branched-chain amino acid transport system ATP-binding protein